MYQSTYTRRYYLGHFFEDILKRAGSHLVKYLDDEEIFHFNRSDNTLQYASERIIPTIESDRPKVMLLFSNPHPHSVKQGMFLSPNRIGRENLFWPIMDEANWIKLPEPITDPKIKADIISKLKYKGPYNLSFYCYWSFPTDLPGHIKKIFGSNFFENVIEQESRKEFMNTLEKNNFDAVITFNKDIFNHVAELNIKKYIDELIENRVIKSKVVENGTPIYITFPTGWRYRKDFMRYRVRNLESIKNHITKRSN